ncbi:MAG: aminopeptidase P N-terminal domain-containing protein [Halorhodospira halophila]|uniref:aminopeptidase P N-terminal domain-containing protein n=1 Tax=Halorhodospira TaxID=85108 RepID=UPI0019129257|nr:MULTISPECIES: aminopeptidase P N-terminal domain-containing protein [Halorhodospira]MBK5936371.1 Xaa-Pro aminopeptidase [Halorhodospira halophila]MBK5943540.1 Xaa-Pro aminopeptidase [Halorhodospira halophila]MCC3750156.1 aminopeptidase P N-terminal domain-containing protein [Halorhodospira halophila]MCG5527070.1 aminopeptidase P N-terminal domain-containing protein [Halorhodospira halophila]MCG5532301.1 aminopeptidase P N-terminal domain-containing protein [Halorhodospira sp. 9621]
MSEAIDFRQLAREQRETLARRMGEAAVAVIPAAREQPRNRDVDHPFRQDSDFRYLTAFPEPDAVAVIAPGRPEGEYILFVRERDPDAERWAGARTGPEAACAAYGADQAWPLSELDQRLPDLLVGRERLIGPLGRDEHWDRRLLQWLQAGRERARGLSVAPSSIELLDHNIHEQRLIKRPAELEAMRRAAGISVAAHRRAMQVVQPDMPEYTLAAELLGIFHRHGGEAAYPSIVAGGANACVLHYITLRDRLREGDLVLIDAGAEVDGYAADITRTFPVSGSFSAEQRAVYDVVLAAQEAAIEQVRSGNDFDAFHRTATRILTQGMVDLGWLEGEVDGLIEQGAHRRFFPHRTGHWLGLDVHDVGSYAVEGAWRVLHPGMVVTVEPGLYCPPGSEEVDRRWHGIGVRIEDDVVVERETPRVLTSGVPKTPEAIEDLMGAVRGAGYEESGDFD